MYHCLCCGFRTLLEQPPDTYWICPVCGWEDDLVQAEDLDFAGGANRMSLRVARETFRQTGAKSPERERRRPPTELEQPGIRFHELPEPIDRWLRTRRPSGGHLSALVNELMEELVYWDTVVAINLLPRLEGIPVT